MSSSSSTMQMTYYVRFVGADGTALSGDGGAQWFQLSDFAVGFSNSASIGSATGGAGAGKATFNPLSLKLPSNELPQLDNLLFTGGHLSQIEVAGYANSGGTQMLVDDYLFGTDFLTAASTDISGAQQLSVAFGQVQQSHYSQSTTGAVQPPTQIGWDVVTNSADPGGIAAPPTGPVATASTPAPSVYYVRFVGADGTALSGDGGAQWFQLSDFAVGFSNSASIGSATGGAGAGKATFNPLSLKLPSNELPQLDNLLFTGGHLSQIEVAGYANSGGTQMLVDDYLFGTDFLTAASTDISGAQQLSVAFGQVQQSHYSQSTTGAVQPPTQIGWDVVTNSADPGGIAAPPTGPVATASTPAPSVYYVRFVGADGTALSGDGGAQWFQLSDFAVGFSNSASIGSATGGAGAGKATFNPLSLKLPSNELPQLDNLLFTGGHLSQIEVAGYANSGGTQMLVDDYLFGTDFLTAASTDISGAQQLSVAFGQVQQSHYSQSTTGAVQPPTQIGWDVVTNSADPGGIAAPPTGPVATASTPAPSVYYVRFVGADGTALSGDGGAQWFQLSDFAVGFSNSASIGSATGGAGAGKATFNPLSLKLPSNELPQLDNLLFTGGHLSQIEVAGYANSGGTQMLVDDYLFGTDFLTAASTDISGAQQLSVAFGQVQQSHYSQSTTGAVQPPTQIGWDVVTNSADPGGIAAPPTGPVATASTPAPSVYYVRFVGADGTALSGDGGAQWFQLSDFAVGFSNSASIGSATGGAGAGKATFNPLSLKLPSNELPQLDNLLFTGGHLSQIEVAGYANSGGTQMLVDDYLFGTDFLTAASTDISGAQQLSVAFGQVQQSHYSQSTTGAVQPPTQIGWDVVTNSADPGGIAAPPTGPVATASTPAPSVYYVRFVGADGTALSGDGGAQWFQLSDFAVGFSNSASIGSATGGAGAGKATFNPLSLKLPSNELPQLDNLLFTGGHLSQIEVAGYANSGGTQMLVDDYLFGTDFLTAASTDISGAQQLSVAFGQVQQSHYSQSTTGAVQPPTQIGWDVVTNSADPGGIAAPPTGPVATASTPAPSVYYVRFVGADGTALSGDGGAQWFQLSDFAVGFSNSASIGSATGGAGAGKATFNPLSLKLPSNELPQLDNLLFTGGHLSQIEVAGYANSGGTQMLVDDYLFGTDFLTAASTDISGAQQLSVAFGQVQQSHYSQSTTGAVQPPTQIGWDVVTNSADPGGIAAPPTGPVATASTPAPSVYYVRFVGADGTALSGDGGAQWFQLSDFAVGFSNSASIGSATGGAGAGKATFNPLSLKLPSNELPQLDNLLFTGGHLSQIEVAGYANSGGTQMLVDDYLFGTDFLTAASTDISGAQQLSVAFGQVQQSHYSQSTTGAVQPPTQIGWDVVTNSADPGGIAAPPTGPVATASTPAPSVYYVRFVGADGTALSGDGGAQWFQLSDFAVGFSNSASIGSATGGAGAGKATFNPLSLKLPSNELPQLDNLLFTGGHLSQIEVAGYANSGGTQMLVDDYLFGTDFLTAASTDISGAQQLSVAFGQVQQSHYSQSTTGAVQPPTQIGWDVVTNSADPAVSPPRQPGRLQRPAPRRRRFIMFALSAQMARR